MPTISKEQFEMLFVNFTNAAFKKKQINYPIAIWGYNMEQIQLPFHTEIINPDFVGIRKIQKNEITSQIVIIKNFTAMPNKILIKILDNIQNECYDALFVFNDDSKNIKSNDISDKMINFCIIN